MVFAPKALGSRVLDPAVLAEDRRRCLRIGPCGVGEKALYLNSFFLKRRYYLCYEEITRAFKRVAMTRGGFDRKGPFGSMPYLVVVYGNGQEKACNFKREEQVDQLIAEVTKRHPSIRPHSAKAEEKLERARRAEEESFVKEAGADAERACRKLELAAEHLEKQPAIYRALAETAQEKRARAVMKPGILSAAWAMLAAAVFCGVFGGIKLAQRQSMGFYFLLFAAAFAFLVISSRVLPIGRGSRRAVDARWAAAVRDAERHLEGFGDFPVPARYAHPVVIRRMVRAIRQGRAQTETAALEVVKEDLKKLNAGVRVTQAEYDEVVAVKPLFLVCNYE